VTSDVDLLVVLGQKLGSLLVAWELIDQGQILQHADHPEWCRALAAHAGAIQVERLQVHRSDHRNGSFQADGDGRLADGRCRP
jgi:hypothetical protein